MIRIGEEAPHRAIAICFSAAAAEGRQRTLAKYVLEIVRPLLAKNEKFDVLPVKANSNLWEDMVRTVSPFYDRVI